MKQPPNYIEAIKALVASNTAENLATLQAEERRRAAVAAEAEALMRPLVAVMESHPDVERIDEAATSPGGASVYRRSYRRRPGSGQGAFRGIVAIALDPPAVSRREIYIKTDTSCINYLTISAQTRGKAVADKADSLIPLALEWCAKLLTPKAP